MSKLITSLKQILENELRLLKNYGVDHIGYRYFLSDGRSFGCPTVKEWYQKYHPDNFYEEMKRYLSEELVMLKSNQFSYVTRSADHKKDNYLIALKDYNLDNSLGIYKFGSHRIDSFFFICGSKDAEARDTLLNNLRYLEGHANALSKKIDRISPIINSLDNAHFYLDKDTCYQLFQTDNIHNKNNTKYISIIFEGRAIPLTQREIETLMLLRNAASNKAIANGLEITEKTVEKHIHSIKGKLAVNARHDLIKIANMPQLATVYKREFYV